MIFDWQDIVKTVVNNNPVDNRTAEDYDKINNHFKTIATYQIDNFIEKQNVEKVKVVNIERTIEVFINVPNVERIIDTFKITIIEKNQVIVNVILVDDYLETTTIDLETKV